MSLRQTVASTNGLAGDIHADIARSQHQPYATAMLKRIKAFKSGKHHPVALRFIQVAEILPTQAYPADAEQPAKASCRVALQSDIPQSQSCPLANNSVGTALPPMMQRRRYG